MQHTYTDKHGALVVLPGAPDRSMQHLELVHTGYIINGKYLSLEQIRRWRESRYMQSLGGEQCLR